LRPFFFALLALSLSSHAQSWNEVMTRSDKARALMQKLDSSSRVKPVNYAIFDISFYGVEQVVADALAPDYSIRSHSLYSPHGASVASIISSPRMGGTKSGILKVMNTGIYDDDFEYGEAKLRGSHVKLVHASLGLRDSKVAALVQRMAQEQGMIFVLSAGNSAQRLGRSLKDYYQGLPAIVVSCVDEDGMLADFAQLDSSVTVMAPCGMSNIKSLALDRSTGKVVEYAFGQTSAGAPQVSRAVLDLLSLYPELTLEEVRTLIQKSATEFIEFEGEQYPLLNHENLIRMALSRYGES